jgi:hypothetical protein
MLATKGSSSNFPLSFRFSCRRTVLRGTFAFPVAENSSSSWRKL